MTRRKWMAIAACAPGISALRAQPRKLKVLVAGGHPGDPEYGCGGTICRYVDQGHDVALLYLNRGEKTCPESPEQSAANPRVAEAKRACEILKARPIFAPQCDAHAVVDSARYDEFRAIVEAENPDVLFTHWPVDNHRDHRAIAMLSLDAWLRLNRRFALYYYEVSDGEDTAMFAPSDYVDISSAEPRTPTRRSRRTNIMRCRTRLRVSAEWRAATSGRRHLRGMWRVRRDCCRDPAQHMSDRVQTT